MSTIVKKTGKAPGPDGIINEMFKYGENGMLQVLCYVLLLIWCEVQVTGRWLVVELCCATL